MLILDNERARARPVVLRTTHSVQLEVLSPGRAGLQIEALAPGHGRIRLSVAANSVVALSAV